MQAILKRTGNNKFHLFIGKKRKNTEFVSPRDCAEWAGTMKAHGLYPDMEIYLEMDGALKHIEPTYDHPCELPAIAR